MKNKNMIAAFFAGCFCTLSLFALIGDGFTRFSRWFQPALLSKGSGLSLNHAFTQKTLENPGQFMTATQFNEARNAWAKDHPGATRGGSISRNYIQEILNSMSHEQGLGFYFGQDGSNTFVMFIPANAAEGSNPPVYRNTSYCPSVCP